MQIIKQIQTAVTGQLPGNGINRQDSIETTLYACPKCSTTYIASEMDRCPECQATLDVVPSGAELGITE